MRIALRIASLSAAAIVATACQQLPSLPTPLQHGPKLEADYDGEVSSVSWLSHEPVERPAPDPSRRAQHFSVNLFEVEREVAVRVLGMPPSGPGAASVDRERLHRKIEELGDAGLARPLFEGPMELAIDRDGEFRYLKQTSYVAGFDLQGSEDSFIADPRIEVANDGVCLRLTAGDEGREIAAELTLAHLPLPIRSVTTEMAAMHGTRVTHQVPVFVNQRLRTRTTLTRDQVLMFGGLATADSGDDLLVAFVHPVVAPQDERAE